MALTGYRVGEQTTITQVSGNQMPDVDRMLYLLAPYQTPLLQHLYFNKVNGGEKVINENGKFSWFEDEYYQYQTQLSGSGISGNGSSEDNIGLSDSTWIASGDVLFVESTEELVYVDSIESSEVDITHIDGSSEIHPATSGYVKKVGSRNHEFATARTAVSTKEVEKENYCEIHSESVTTTGRYQAGRKYTNGKKHKDQVRKKITEMKLEIERNFMFSTDKGSTPVTTDYRHTWGEGALGRITTNKTSYNGALTESALDNYFQSVFAKGSKRKKHYAGSNQISAINTILKDKSGYTFMDNVKEYGLDLARYRTPFGLVDLIWDPVLDGKFINYGMTFDSESVKLRYMDSDEKGSRKMRVEENVQTPGTDGKQTKLLLDVGIQIVNEEENGILYQT